MVFCHVLEQKFSPSDNEIGLILDYENKQATVSCSSSQVLALVHWLLSISFTNNPRPLLGSLKLLLGSFAPECQAIKHFYHSVLINTPFRSEVPNKSLPVFNRCTGTEFFVESSHKWKVQLCGIGAKVFWGVSESRKLRHRITVISLSMSNIISIPQHRMINSPLDYSFCLAWAFIKRALSNEKLQGGCLENQQKRKEVSSLIKSRSFWP